MQTIRQAAEEYINMIHSDVAEACACAGEELDAESLAGAVGDHLHDTREDYRAMPYKERRAMVLKICQNFV